jgi:hypothetical protein
VTELFGAIGGVVVVAMVVAWRVRFRPRPDESAQVASPQVASGARSPSPPPEGPLPPSAFLSAVEKALGQPVLSLRLRTSSDVFRVEPQRRRD